MNISRFFVDRPVFAGVLSVLILIAGLIGLRALPISEYPEVVPPSIVVRAAYPGANRMRGYRKKDTKVLQRGGHSSPPNKVAGLSWAPRGRCV